MRTRACAGGLHIPHVWPGTRALVLLRVLLPAPEMLLPTAASARQLGSWAADCNLPQSFSSPKTPQAQESGGSWLLCLVSVLLEFGVHDFECGQEIAEEEDEEGECQHKYLPFFAFLLAGELKQRDGIVELPELETGRQAALTHPFPWPQKRKGRRKVRPRHIQDWNPSTVRSRWFLSPRARNL